RPAPVRPGRPRRAGRADRAGRTPRRGAGGSCRRPGLAALGLAGTLVGEQGLEQQPRHGGLLDRPPAPGQGVLPVATPALDHVAVMTRAGVAGLAGEVDPGAVVPGADVEDLPPRRRPAPGRPVPARD